MTQAITEIEIIPPKSYAAVVRMCPNSWFAAVTIFYDGQAHVCRSRAHPDRPVIIELEGEAPTPEQLETLKGVVEMLRTDFGFSVWRFCDALLPHAKTLLSVT